jgi:hypothetical protein
MSSKNSYKTLHYRSQSSKTVNYVDTNDADPEEMFSLNDDWRAWTFEIRFAEGHALIQGCAAWTAEKGVIELLKLRQASQPTPFPGEPESILDQFLNRSLNLVGTDSFCEELESWIQTQLGL